DAWSLWNYEEGQQVRVVCYTNTSHARLELNGKVIGQAKPYDQDSGVIYWDIPFSPGKLEVVGLTNGKEITRYAISTSKRPASIQIIEDHKNLKVGEVAQVRIQIVDQDNVPVMISDDMITCKIEGSAR